MLDVLEFIFNNPLVVILPITTYLTWRNVLTVREHAKIMQGLHDSMHREMLERRNPVFQVRADTEINIPELVERLMNEDDDDLFDDDDDDTEYETLAKLSANLAALNIDYGEEPIETRGSETTNEAEDRGELEVRLIECEFDCVDLLHSADPVFIFALEEDEPLCLYDSVKREVKHFADLAVARRYALKLIETEGYNKPEVITGEPMPQKKRRVMDLS